MPKPLPKWLAFGDVQCEGLAVYFTNLVEVFGVGSASQDMATDRILGVLEGADNGFLKEVCPFDGAFQDFC